MSAISPFSSAYNLIAASNAAKTSQQSARLQDDGATSSVAAAQAQSAREDQQAQQVAADNAASFKDLADKGLTVKQVSFASLYKDKVLSAVDSDGDKTVSESELLQQVLSGGGSAAQATALYKAMDMDSDGTVTAKEFEDSIQNPFTTAEFEKKVADLVAQVQAGSKDPSSVIDVYFNLDVNPAQILGDLAKEFPA